jgi:MFS family permease
VIGVTLQAAAQNYSMFMVGRTIGGLACGVVFSICPIYASELSPAHFRGRVGGFYGQVSFTHSNTQLIQRRDRLNITASFLLTQCVGLGLYFVRGNTSWRLLFGLQYGPPIVLAIFSFKVPESPRWLCLKGRDKEALETLRLLHGGDRVANHAETSSYYEEFLQIRSQIEEEKTYTTSWCKIVQKKSYLRRFALVTGFFFFQQ